MFIIALRGWCGNLTIMHRCPSTAPRPWRGIPGCKCPISKQIATASLPKWQRRTRIWTKLRHIAVEAIEVVEAEKVDSGHAGHAYFHYAQALVAQRKKDAAKAQYEIAYKLLNSGGLDHANTALQLGIFADTEKRWRDVKGYLTEVTLLVREEFHRPS